MLIYHKTLPKIKIGHMGGSRDRKALLNLKKILSDFQSSIVISCRVCPKEYADKFEKY